METTVKKREWVKDAAIIFLAVLLVLTFFSNTIMNRSLPEVATAAVNSGSIVAKVRGSGVVTATGKQQVKAKEMRTIRSVMIKIGQEVNAGDVLFVLGQGDETALEQAKNTLRALQYTYQRDALNAPTFDGGKYDREVDSAYESLIRAEQSRDRALEAYNLAVARDSAAEIQATNAEVMQLESQLKSVSAQLNDARATYDERVDKAWADVDAAQAAYDEAYMGGGLIELDENAEVVSSPDIDTLWKNLEDAKYHLSEIQNDSYLTSLQTQYDNLLERYN